MRKIASLFVALLLLAGCSSVPLTGRKQVLLVSDQEVLSSSLTQYNDYIKTAKKIDECEQKRYGNPGRKEDSRRYGGLFAGKRDGG